MSTQSLIHIIHRIPTIFHCGGSRGSIIPENRTETYIKYKAAFSWSYLIWAIELIRREAPKGYDIKSWVRFSGMAKIFFYVPGVYEYEIRHTVLHIKMAAWLLLEAAQTSLSNLLVLAVSYDIMLHFTRTVALVSCETNKYACVETTMQRKKNNTMVRACIRLLCTWHLIECTVHL